METPVIKGVVFGFALFLLVAVLGIIIYVFAIGQDASKSSSKELNTINADMNEQKYLVYEDMELSGSQVINSIKKLENDGKANKIGIQVKTGANKVGVWYYNTFSGDNGSGTLISDNGEKDVKKAYDTNSQSHYVNPAGSFSGEILRDNNNTIRGVVFTQDNAK